MVTTSISLRQFLDYTPIITGLILLAVSLNAARDYLPPMLVDSVQIIAVVTVFLIALFGVTAPKLSQARDSGKEKKRVEGIYGKFLSELRHNVYEFRQFTEPNNTETIPAVLTSIALSAAWDKAAGATLYADVANRWRTLFRDSLGTIDFHTRQLDFEAKMKHVDVDDFEDTALQFRHHIKEYNKRLVCSPTLELIAMATTIKASLPRTKYENARQKYLSRRNAFLDLLARIDHEVGRKILHQGMPDPDLFE